MVNSFKTFAQTELIARLGRKISARKRLHACAIIGRSFVTAKAEISYTQTGYQGVGQLEAADKSGTTVKGKSELSGKRLGDCPK